MGQDRRTAYTTAPVAYDGCGTLDGGIVGYDDGRPLRRVQIEVQQYDWQASRYGSGMYACLNEEQYKELWRCGWYVPAEAGQPQEPAAHERTGR